VPRILIVEDSPTMRSLLASSLEELDGAMKITEAGSGFEALRQLPRDRYDLVVTDINMPDINGLELVSFVKNNDAYRDIPLLIVSTEGSERDVGKGLQSRRIPRQAVRSGRAARNRPQPARSSFGRSRLAPVARITQAEREFVSEAEEILESMRGDLADLSDAQAAAREADPELVNRLFRSAHSLKALAGMFRFAPIEDLAHRLEDLLDALRLGRVPLGSAVVERIEDSVALFGSLLGSVGDSEALEASGGAIAELIRRIELASSGEPEADDAFDALPWMSTRPCCARSPSTRSIGFARTSVADDTSCWSTRCSRSSRSRKGSPSCPP
jgi:two-component system chemotaxis response regulator CheY